MLIELAHFHPKLKDYGVLTFEDLMSLPFGHRGSQFVLFAMLITAYGAMVAYMLIIKDTLPVVLGLEDAPGEGSFIEREVVMIVASASIMLPLSLQRDMSSLAFTSLLSVLADGLLVLFIGAYSPIRESLQQAGGFGPVLKEHWINGPGFFIGFGVMTTAMTCQHSAFIVSGSLANLTSSRWATVTFRSLTIAGGLCAVLGVTGYLGFLDETQGDILNNFAPDTLEASAARVLLAITMFFTYPMEAFVARHVLLKLFFDGDMDGPSVVDPQTGQPVAPAKMLGCCNRRHVWTIVIYLAALFPALLVDDLGPVLSITGSIGGCSLAYVGPGLAYLGVNGEAFLQYLAEKLGGRSTTTVPPESLPVEGQANATMQVAATSSIDDLAKPWWWYLTLMPLWASIGSRGSRGMQERLTALEQEHGPVSNDGSTEPPTGVEIIGPCVRDYWMSIFFIFFGVLAGVAGVVSNVFVQINDIFYTPT